LSARYERRDNRLSISWKSDSHEHLLWKHDLHEKLTYAVLAKMDSGRQFTLIRGLTEAHYDADLDRIPAEGAGRIVVVVNSGVRSSEIEVATFTLAPRPPVIHIISPASGSRLPFGQPVSAIGVCHDMSGRSCAQDAVWQLDGQPLTIGRLTAVVENTAAGPHTLTLIYGRDGQARSTSVEFVTDEPDEHYEEWVRAHRAPGPNIY
jgi:hypothetical protein